MYTGSIVLLLGIPTKVLDDTPQSTAPKKVKKKVKKVKGSKKKKASFKKTNKRGLAALMKPNIYYKAYDVSGLPPPARPDLTKPNRGEHSYTLTSGSSCIEVLLRQKAYFVKRVGEGGTGPKGQVSWKLNGGSGAAWRIAIERAGFPSTDDI